MPRIYGAPVGSSHISINNHSIRKHLRVMYRITQIKLSVDILNLHNTNTLYKYLIIFCVHSLPVGNYLLLKISNTYLNNDFHFANHFRVKSLW